MTSDKQIEANRRNALRSTGPKTQVGKACVSKNAIKHGLLSKELLLADEDGRALRAMRESLYRALQPEGALEELLVDRVIFGFWRLRRLGQMGAEGFLTNRPGCLVSYQCWNLFGRYEAAAERSLYRALHELERLQARRKGDHVAPPVAVDIAVSGTRV